MTNMRKERLGKYLIWLYFAVTALDLIGVGLKNYGLELVSKPLIMVSLIAFYWVVSNKRSPIYLAALIFSLSDCRRVLTACKDLLSGKNPLERNL